MTNCHMLMEACNLASSRDAVQCGQLQSGNTVGVIVIIREAFQQQTTYPFQMRY